MGLSEHEQKILKDIEQQLSASDPVLVNKVSETTVYKYSGRVIQLAVLALILGAVFMVLTFTTSVILGAIGFLIMLAALLVIESHLRKIGKATFTAAREAWTQLGARSRTRRWGR